MRRFAGFAALGLFLAAVPIGALRLLFRGQFVRALAAAVAISACIWAFSFATSSARLAGRDGFNIATGAMMVVALLFPFLVGGVVLAAPGMLERADLPGQLRRPRSNVEMRARIVGLVCAAGAGIAWTITPAEWRDSGSWLRLFVLAMVVLSVFQGLFKGFLGVNEPWWQSKG